MKKSPYFKKIIPVISVCLLFIAACGKNETLAPSTPGKTVFNLIAQIKNDKSSPFYIDFSSYPPEGSRERRVLPVGVFDSGTGGLTVLNAILKMDGFNNKTHEPGPDGIPDFRDEGFLYLGDSANMPYGRYDGEGRADFLRELIIKDTAFLLGRRYYLSPEDETARTSKPPAKAVVIACNTATAFGLETVREAVGKWGTGTRVLGIIDAGARTAVGRLPQNGQKMTIGIMATEGTCASRGYPRSVKREFKKKYQGRNIAVVQQAGFGLAAAIDGDKDYVEGNAKSIRAKDDYKGPGLTHKRYKVDLSLWGAYHFEEGPGLLLNRDDKGTVTEVQLNSVTNYIRYHVTHLVANAAQQFPDRRLSTVILGCTHYPFFQKEIEAHFLYLSTYNGAYKKILTVVPVMVDPARSLAGELYAYLAKANLLRPENAEPVSNRFYISVPNPFLKRNQLAKGGGFTYAYKYGRGIDSGLEFVKRVPFSPQWIKQEVLDRIKSKMPDIYQMFSKNEREK